MTGARSTYPQQTADYRRIATAIDWLRANASRQPSLGEVAVHVGLSPHHCQRLFRRFAGISPKRFVALLTVGHARQQLDRSDSVLDAALAAGLSGPGRLHDHCVTVTGMSPGEARRGDGLVIHHGLADSPFGRVFIAATTRGVCHLSFVDLETPADPAGELLRRWPRAGLLEDPAGSAALAGRIFARQPLPDGPMTLAVYGTNFQLQVWQALLRIPPGRVASYARLAASIGRPQASRAVANAIGANPVAWLIPCHRVLRTSGELGGYRWGTERKQLMLAREWSGEEPPG